MAAQATNCIEFARFQRCSLSSSGESAEIASLAAWHNFDIRDQIRRILDPHRSGQVRRLDGLNSRYAANFARFGAGKAAVRVGMEGLAHAI